MILLDIINNNKIINGDDTDFSENKLITLKFINNYENYQDVECDFINNLIQLF
jgi:hypothetical protein